MPLEGEYEPSTSDWAREHTETYLASGGTEGTERKGRQRAVATWPDYADYQKKTDRQIPVFVLTPVN